jgi:uncharacterized membrane protein (UPF0127 family)
MRTRERLLTLIFVGLCLSGLPAVLSAQNPPSMESLDHFPQNTAQIRTEGGIQKFRIWIADTRQRSEQGLMFVHSLRADQGMLFPRNNPGPMAMWMKNTLIPLDMLFLDAHGQIIFIMHSATPQSEAIIRIPAPIVTPAEAVLELAGGECERRHISQGDRLSLTGDN